VERGVDDGDAADGHGAEAGDGGQGAGAADLDVDGLQHGSGALGGELVGGRPARQAAREAQPPLPVQPVHLVDHAVDVVAEVRAAALEVGVDGQQGLDAVGGAGVRADRQPQLAKVCSASHCVSANGRADEAPGVGDEAQRPAGGDRGVQLAQEPAAALRGLA
jgi:hypothetical protein